MSSRSRHSAAEVIEPKSTPNVLRRLHFNETLSWRAGKPIPISELIRRLTALSKELRDSEQEEIDRNSFTKAAKELTGHGLLSHKDGGVRAWTACCLVEVLRLFAPDAPYNGAQLKVTKYPAAGLYVADCGKGYLHSGYHVYPSGTL